MTNDESADTTGKKTLKEANATQSTKAKGEGGEPSSPSLPKSEILSQAKEILTAIKEQNQRAAQNLKKAEMLTVENMMSGKSSAGRELTQEERVIQEARNILKGTGYEDELFPVK